MVSQIQSSMNTKIISFYYPASSQLFYRQVLVCIVTKNFRTDIIDGFGSYPHQFMSTPVFCGLGAVAFKYYMLFQHQSVPDEGPADEPSWLMGAARGPYINELSRSIFVSLGKNVALLALDCRTERMVSNYLQCSSRPSS